MKNIWVPLSGAIAQQRNVETIANNVANANTIGFKKDQLVFKEYLTAIDNPDQNPSQDLHLPNKEWKPEDFYHTQGAENAAVKVAGSYTVHQQGQITQTGNPLDLAIQGDGFFEVLTPQGVRFTRKGNFSLSSDGELVTDQNYKVLSKLDLTSILEAQGNNPREQSISSPEERIIKIPSGQIAFAGDGKIYVNDRLIGELSVTEFGDHHALRKEGNTLYVNPDIKNVKTTIGKTTIHQGMLEQSNVNAVQEMSELIKAHRHFESIQRALNTYDNMTGRAVNDIAKF